MTADAATADRAALVHRWSEPRITGYGFAWVCLDCERIAGPMPPPRDAVCDARALAEIGRLTRRVAKTETERDRHRDLNLSSLIAFVRLVDRAGPDRPFNIGPSFRAELLRLMDALSGAVEAGIPFDPLDAAMVPVDGAEDGDGPARTGASVPGVSEAGMSLGQALPDDLDPGIRDIVALLWRHGFTTTESGDGVSKPADARTLDLPHVFAVAEPGLLIAEAHRLADLLAGEGAGWTVEASYSPRDGVGLLMAMFLPDEDAP